MGNMNSSSGDSFVYTKTGLLVTKRDQKET
jgi:hypothetical protein